MADSRSAVGGDTSPPVPGTPGSGGPPTPDAQEAHSSSAPRSAADDASHAFDDADALLLRVAAGDHDAFAGLYDLVAGSVYGTSRRVLRDASRAEEVAQDVLTEVWRTAVRFDPERGSARAWVMTIAHRRAVDRVRSDHASAVRDDRIGRQSVDRDHDVVIDAVEQLLEVQALRGCLDTLSDIQRESVLLAYYGGHTYAEVARILGAPLGTVKTRMRDGLIRLKNCLGVSL